MWDVRHVPSQGKCTQTPLLLLSWKAESTSVRWWSWDTAMNWTEEPLRRSNEKGRMALPTPVIELPLLNNWWRREKRQIQETTWWFPKWLWSVFLRVTYSYGDGGAEYLEADVFEITGRTTAFLPSTKQSHVDLLPLSWTIGVTVQLCVGFTGDWVEYNVSIAILLSHVDPTQVFPYNLHSAA